MTRRIPKRTAAALAVTILLGGCSALGAVSKASAPLDAYTLSPLSRAEGGRRTNLHLVVEVPTATGALGTDRILIKPGALQAQYLPDARWVDAAPVLVQSLMVNSLQNSGRYLRVGRDGAGLLPDYTLITELTDFQIEDAVPQLVRVGISVALIRESDRRIVAARRFEQITTGVAPQTAIQIPAFETAVGAIMTDLVGWVADQT